MKKIAVIAFAAFLFASYTPIVFAQLQNNVESQERKIFKTYFSDEILSLSDEELDSLINRALEELTVNQIGTELNRENIAIANRIEERVLANYSESLNDNQYAGWLISLIGNGIARGYMEKSEARLEGLENALDRALEERGDSWIVKCAVARSLLLLPKGYRVADDGTGKRSFTPIEIKMINDPQFRAYPMMTRPPINTDENVKPIPEGKILYLYERDRARALNLLAESFPEMMNNFVNSSAARVYINEFWTLLAEPYVASLHVKSDDAKSKSQILDEKTEFPIAIPEPSERSAFDPLSAYGGLKGRNVGTHREPSGLRYRMPEDFDSAKNDGERLVYLAFLVKSRTYLANSSNSDSARFAALGSYAQSRFSVFNALKEGQELQKRLLDAQKRIDPNVNLNDPYKAQSDAKIDAIQNRLRSFVQLKENETLLLSEKKVPIDELHLTRFELKGYCNFFELFQRSLELNENYEALSGLAVEYQRRGQYGKAREYWTRAQKVIEDPNVGYGERMRHNDGYGRINEYRTLNDVLPCRRQEIERFLKKRPEGSSNVDPEITIDFQNSGSHEATGLLVVKSRAVKRFDLNARRLDLSQAIATTREEEYRKRSWTFNTLVSSLVGFGKATYEDREPIVWTQELENASDDDWTTTQIELPFHEPGAYVVEVRSEGQDASTPCESAIFFLTNKGFDLRNEKLRVFDLISRKPLANREIEICFLTWNQLSEPFFSETVLTRTDEQGVALLDEMQRARLGLYSTIMAFIQPEDASKADVEIAFYDGGNRHALAPILDSSGVDNGVFFESNRLVVATSKPLYAPGELVEFKGFFLPGRIESARPTANAKAFCDIFEPGSDKPIETLVLKFVNSNNFCSSFKLSPNARPGVYLFQFRCEGALWTGENGVLNDARVPFYVGTTNPEQAADAPRAQIPETNTLQTSVVNGVLTAPSGKLVVDNVAANAQNAGIDDTDRQEDLVELVFPKKRFSIDEQAEIIVRAKPDVAATIYKRAFKNGAYVASEESLATFDDGVYSYRCTFDQSDNRGAVLVVHAIGKDCAQIIFYSVEIIDSAVELDAPKKVAPGEKIKLSAKFKRTQNQGYKFVGSATFALFNAKLPKNQDMFAKYSAFQHKSTKRLCRFDIPCDSRAFDPETAPQYPIATSETITAERVNAPRPSEKNDLNDFIIKKKKRLFQTSSGTIKKFTPSFAPEPLDPDLLLPENNNDEGRFFSCDAVRETDRLDAEFDAPSSPGTWLVVFRGVDEKGILFYAEQEIVVQ